MKTLNIHLSKEEKKAITKALNAHQRIRIIGIGYLDMHKRRAVKIKHTNNILLEEGTIIPAHYRVRFQVSKTLKNQVK